MCIYIYIHTYIYIYIYIHTYIHTYIYIYIYTHTYIYIYMYRERETYRHIMSYHSMSCRVRSRRIASSGELGGGQLAIAHPPRIAIITIIIIIIIVIIIASIINSISSIVIVITIICVIINIFVIVARAGPRARFPRGVRPATSTAPAPPPSKKLIGMFTGPLLGAPSL